MPDVEELCGYIPMKQAAAVIGVEPPSMTAIVYERKVKAVRIAGVILVEKDSAVNFRKVREQYLADLE